MLSKLTSLAELVQYLPSKQNVIGSNPIRCSYEIFIFIFIYL